MQRVFVPATVLVVVLLAGCEQQTSEVAEEAASASSESSSIDLVPITLDQWYTEIAGFEGKIVVSDMWATWCIPCIEKFPHMVDLSHRYAGRGVQFVSTSLDDPTDDLAIAYAREFLVEQQAEFPNYLINENVTDTFERLDLMTIPAVFIYGRDGALRYRLTADDPNNQFTDQDVEDAIEALLAEGS
jgi:thiol-disulfide isomerase/thioredoxin